jgi:hypothetical protein
MCEDKWAECYRSIFGTDIVVVFELKAPHVWNTKDDIILGLKRRGVSRCLVVNYTGGNFMISVPESGGIIEDSIDKVMEKMKALVS